MDERHDSPPWRRHRHEVVDPAVTRAKFERQIDDWRSNQVLYRSRGWILADHGDRWAELILLSEYHPRVVAASVGIDYVNFDLEPPSITFIDAVTRQPSKPPVTPIQMGTDGNPQPLVVSHPELGRPMLCLPGNYEYHSHPQHDGESWLGPLRQRGQGNLAVIADHLHQTTVQDRIFGLQLVPDLGGVNPQAWQARVAASQSGSGKDGP